MSQSSSSLQRSKSAPFTVSSLAEERKPLARTMSHEHVQQSRAARDCTATSSKQQHAPRRPMARTPLADVEEDPFNLGTFFPGGLGRREGSWQSWVRQEEGDMEEEEGDGWDEEAVESPTIFTPVEDNHSSEAIKGETARPAGDQSLDEDEDEGVLLSPYALEDAVDEASLFEHFRRRREGG